MGYLKLCLCFVILFRQTQARNAKPDDPDERDEDQITIGWQVGYEKWQRQCEKYELPATQQEAAISTRIANGELAQKDMFPYQAGLILQLGQGKYRQCGGSLITLQFVLTAAHCLIDSTRAKIYLGSNQYANATDAQNVFQVERQNFNVYPGYLGFGGYNDLALLRLPRPATPTSSIQTIPLARPFMQQSLLEGQLVTTLGWGALGDNLNVTKEQELEEDLLHYVTVRVLEQQLCLCYFLPGLVSSKRHICSDGRGGRGGCQGDSGGPLVYRWHNVSYLIGLTTFGSAKGCELGAPTVYTRVTAYLDWIVSKTNMES
ncbi:brachyurin [Drosophila grimshawi]|uniref:GH15021 n=1 Tax=Drosophila grimshawi TaxID=7222 RepID=B4J003_DROGR|nr:brachyurin [Drosophila grimshawi]EDV96775.1 GH15021 [Drosophila grimshawi]EDW05193.1 GH23745 [Drosophila grimshawi]